MGIVSTNASNDLRLLGTTDGNTQVHVPVTTEGHLEVAIHDPINPFMSVHAEGYQPVFQVDPIYGQNTTETLETTGIVGAGTTSGTVTYTNTLFTCSTGTTALSFATVQSRRRLKHRPGQGVIGRFSALFSTPVASSIVVAGFGHAESGVYFGYNGTSFGILHSNGGTREIQTLTVTTASTSTNSYQVTLNGISTTVTATNNGSTVKTAYEISKGNYPGWRAMQRGSTVIFLSNDVGNKAETFSIAQSGAATPAAGSFAETLAGTSSTDTWVAQTAWNGDKLDGTGPSGFTLDPSKGNIYQIEIQNMGFGVIKFKVLVTSADNNSTFVTAHTLNFPNTRTTPTFKNPSFPFTMAAYSAGSTTNVSVSVSAFAGFVEGKREFTGPRLSYGTTSTAVSTGAYYCLATIRNDLTFNSKANQTVVNILGFGGAHDDATPVTLYLIRNATLVGTPNFSSYSTNSCTSIDTSATTCTVTNNEQIIFEVPIGQGGSILASFEDQNTIQPGDTITIAAQAVTGTATYTIFTLNTREDQ